MNGNWYHLVGIDDGVNLKVYINGNEVRSGSSATRISGVWSVKVGARGTTNYFDGTIDEVHIYDRALSAAEIRKHYVEGLEKHKNLTIK